jgi:hypothetical protein
VEEAAAIKQLELSSRLEELAAENTSLRDSLKEANASNLDLKGQLEVQAKQVGSSSGRMEYEGSMHSYMPCSAWY